MADVTLTYVPVTGNTFDPDQWNRNVDSTTGAESLYGELDGRITDANFSAGAAIRPEHPKPFETFRYRVDSLPGTLDYFQDAFDQADAQDEESPATDTDPFQIIAGCSTRLYLPYACTAVLYHVSLFYTVFQMRERAFGGETEVRTGPVSQLKMYIDGTGVQYTQRRTPRTYHPRSQTTPSVTEISPIEHEDRLTMHLDLAHLSIWNGSDPGRTTAGWHQVDLRLYVAPNSGYEKFSPPFKPAAANIEYPTRHRFRCGIRAARALAFL